jgi:hypothetical protein
MLLTENSSGGANKKDETPEGSYGYLRHEPPKTTSPDMTQKYIELYSSPPGLFNS